MSTGRGQCQECEFQVRKSLKSDLKLLTTGAQAFTRYNSLELDSRVGKHIVEVKIDLRPSHCAHGNLFGLEVQRDHSKLEFEISDECANDW